MAVLHECLQTGATSTGVIGWLNANAGAVTGIATAALAILTGVYVFLTMKIAGAALEQTRLMARAQDAVRREREHARSRHVRHLIGELDQLTFPLLEPQLMPRGVPWTPDELEDLRVLAAAVEGTDERAVSQALRALRELASFAALLYARGSSAVSAPERFTWNENLQAARAALRVLAGEPH